MFRFNLFNKHVETDCLMKVVKEKTLLESDHLMNIIDAKTFIESVLKKRINSYEERLKKPWYERGWEYINSNYGEEGYKRTIQFLEDMKTIHCTADLIRLTANEVYQQGTNLPYLLQQAVVQMCGFNQEHIEVIKEDIYDAVARHPQQAQSILPVLHQTAISRIYEEIIRSEENNGSDYLSQLKQRVMNNTFSGSNKY